MCAAITSFCTFVVATADADLIYVANANGVITKFNVNGTSSVFASDSGNSSVLSNPNGLAFDNNGNLYAANFATSSIEKFTQDGIGSIFATAGISFPYGVAFDATGNLYITNANNTIQKVTPTGTGSTFARASDGLSGPIGLAFDRNGNLFVANSLSNTIEKFAPGGSSSLFANTGLNQPEGLAFDSTGNLYVANGTGNTIEQFTPTGASSVFLNTGLSGPMGLAFDSSGNFYVANSGGGPFGNTVDRITPNGNSTVFATGLSEPTFIATQTPEAASLAILNAGLVCLLKRRRWNSNERS